MKLRPWMFITALLAAGCQASVPTTRVTHGMPGAVSSDVQILGQAPAGQKIAAATAINDPLRVINPASSTMVELIGKVKLISDKGLGVISNNGGNLISDKGLGIIANNAGSLVAMTGGALTSRYQALDATAQPAGTASPTAQASAAPAPKESLLANATIEVLDGAGNVLVDAQNKPITTTSDATGSYQFQAPLPAENLVLRVKLYNGGELEALLPKADSTGARTINIDTASTLGATYVLNQYVQGNATVYQRLPAADAAALQADMEAAAATLTTPPSYQPTDTVALAGTLKQQSAPVNATLEKIKAELLLGQKALGAGLPATSVPLTLAIATYRDSQDNTYIAESLGRVRKVDPAGNISLYAGFGPSGPVIGALGLIADMVGKPDGTLYLSEWAKNDIVMISPAGQMSVVAGGGSNTGDGVAATACKLGITHRMAVGPDGTLYFAERCTPHTAPGRVLHVTSDGVLHALPPLDAKPGLPEAQSLAVGPDGTVYALTSWERGGNSQAPVLYALAPGATSWTPYWTAPPVGNDARVLTGPDGALYFSDSNSGTILKLGQGTSTLFLGGGQSPLQDGANQSTILFNNPTSFWLGADGTALIVDPDNSLVEQVNPKGIVQRFAGADGLTQVGSSLDIALNAPLGLAIDAQGNIVYAESAGDTIKRLVGTSVQLIAGSKEGHADGPAASATFQGPTGIAYDAAGNLWVLDAGNAEVRKIDPSGTVSTVAGVLMSNGIVSAKTPALQAAFGNLTGIAIDPQGRPVFTDSRNHQILRLDADNTVELIAGSPAGQSGDSGDGGPAAQALLNNPAGLAFDKAGNLYVADSGNLRIRMIDPSGKISGFAGLDPTLAAARLLQGAVDTGNVTAAQALFMAPVGLWMDSQGNLFVAESGSSIMQNGQGAAGGGVTIPNLPFMPARIRKIAPDGTVSIVAGAGGQALNGQNDTSGANSLLSPISLALDGQGRLAIVDMLDDQLKILPQGSF